MGELLGEKAQTAIYNQIMSELKSFEHILDSDNRNIRYIVRSKDGKIFLVKLNEKLSRNNV